MNCGQKSDAARYVCRFYEILEEMVRGMYGAKPTVYFIDQFRIGCSTPKIGVKEGPSFVVASISMCSSFLLQRNFSSFMLRSGFAATQTEQNGVQCQRLYNDQQGLSGENVLVCPI